MTIYKRSANLSPKSSDHSIDFNTVFSTHGFPDFNSQNFEPENATIEIGDSTFVCCLFKPKDPKNEPAMAIFNKSDDSTYTPVKVSMSIYNESLKPDALNNMAVTGLSVFKDESDADIERPLIIFHFSGAGTSKVYLRPLDEDTNLNSEVYEVKGDVYSMRVTFDDPPQLLVGDDELIELDVII